MTQKNMFEYRRGKLVFHFSNVAKNDCKKFKENWNQLSTLFQSMYFVALDTFHTSCQSALNCRNFKLTTRR